MAKRLNRFRRQMRQRSKMLIVWSILLMLACVYWLRTRFGITSIHQVNKLASEAKLILIYTACAVVPAVIAWGLYLRKSNLKRAKQLATHPFRSSPALYHKRVIRLPVKVVRVFPTNVAFTFRRWVLNFISLLVKNGKHRNSHRRFLVSSPQLERDKLLLIVHNLDAADEKVNIRPGIWLDVQGEYIHRQGKGPDKKDLRYGLVHFTHSPRGHLYQLRNKPKNPELPLKIRRFS